MRGFVALVALAIPLGACATWNRTPVITADAQKDWPDYADCIAASLQTREATLNATVSTQKLTDQEIAVVGLVDAGGTQTNIRVVATGQSQSHATAVMSIISEAYHRDAIEEVVYGCRTA
jgi:hypothetical protein